MFQEKVISADKVGEKGGRKQLAGFARFCPNESFVELKHTVLEFIFLMALDALQFSS